MKCKKCGKELRDGSRFCVFCGAGFEEMSGGAAPAANVSSGENTAPMKNVSSGGKAEPIKNVSGGGNAAPSMNASGRGSEAPSMNASGGGSTAPSMNTSGRESSAPSMNTSRGGSTAPSMNAPSGGNAASAANAKVCQTCGKEIPAGNSFCIYCGAKAADNKAMGMGSFSSNPLYGKGNKAADDGKNRTMTIALIAVLAAIVVIVAAVLVYFLAIQGASSVDEETSEATEEATLEDIVISEEQDEAVNEIIETVKAICRSTSAGISNRFYDEAMITSGVKAYYDSDGLKAVVATNSMAYVREYYYDGGTLVYASYDGSDAHEFYFENGRAVRWNYTDESGNTEARNAENASGFAAWEEKILAESDEFVRLWEESAAQESAAEYILEGSDSRYISESELEGFTKEECRLARNEIYARHGRKFEDESLMEYFSQFDWYEPTIEASAFKESMLNAYEVANRDLIVAYESKQGYR